MKVGPQVAQAKHIGSADFKLHSLKENLAGTLSFVENMKTTSRLWRGTYALTEEASMERSGWSLITVIRQTLMSCLSSAKLNLESMTTVYNLIDNTAQQIKVA